MFGTARPGTRLAAAMAAALPFVAAADPDPSAAVRAARDRVFPTLVHLKPIAQSSRNGKNVDTTLTGSGVIVSKDGLVVTNFHVAGTAKRVECTLSDRRVCSAELLGGDAATDVALVRLDLAELGVAEVPFAELAGEDRIEVGDQVMAMGSPLGLTRSLSLGVVSCADRYLEGLALASGAQTGMFNTWIQTDAAINPGNSGGPLVDLAGNVVGINARGFRGADNLAFAIPADVVREVAAELLRHGRVVRSSIGVVCQSGGERAPAGTGLLVASVEQGSPAADAGIKAGDRILRFGTAELAAPFDEDLPAARRTMARAPAGVAVEVVVRRGENQRSLQLAPVEIEAPAAVDDEFRGFGVTMRRLSDEDREAHRLGNRTGVLVTGVRAGGPLFQTYPKLRKGDVLLAVGSTAVQDPEQLQGVLDEVVASGRDSAVLRVRRGCCECLLAWRIDDARGAVAQGK